MPRKQTSYEKNSLLLTQSRDRQWHQTTIKFAQYPRQSILIITSRRTVESPARYCSHPTKYHFKQPFPGARAHQLSFWVDTKALDDSRSLSRTILISNLEEGNKKTIAANLSQDMTCLVAFLRICSHMHLQHNHRQWLSKQLKICIISNFVISLYLYCAVSLFESHMHLSTGTDFVALKEGGQTSAMWNSRRGNVPGAGLLSRGLMSRGANVRFPKRAGICPRYRSCPVKCTFEVKKTRNKTMQFLFQV